MPSSEVDDAPSFEEVYSVLGNPVKRRIVELLAERGALSFSELRKELGTSVGALYYNLDGLKDFVDKDASSRKYVLTSKGRALYRALKEGDEAIRRALSARERRATALEKYLLPILVPQRLFVPLYKNAALSALALALSISIGVAATLATRLPLKLIEVEQVPLLFPKNFLSLTLQPEALLAAELAASLLASTATVLLIPRLAFGARAPPLSAAAGVAVSQLPLYAYMLIQYALTGLRYPDVPYATMVTLALALRVFQAATLGLLTAAVSVFCETSKERGFLVASLLLYLSFALKNILP